MRTVKISNNANFVRLEKKRICIQNEAATPENVMSFNYLAVLLILSFSVLT